MWQKFKEQIPAIIITAALVIGAGFVTIQKIVIQQRSELEPLRAQNESLRAQADENRRQIDATTKLLKDALAQSGGTVIRSEEQRIEKLNEERLTRLAQVIAERVIPAIPQPRSAAEVEQSQNEQVDKVAIRLAENIRPVLAGAIAEQNAVTTEVARHSEKRIHELNVGLLATQAAAQDAIKLSREISALYADSFKDQGVLMRLFSLPANLVIDAANLNFISRDRGKIERELSDKTNEIEKRLKEIQSMAAASGG
jgi:hypothetical protein